MGLEYLKYIAQIQQMNEQMTRQKMIGVNLYSDVYGKTYTHVVLQEIVILRIIAKNACACHNIATFSFSRIFICFQIP